MAYYTDTAARRGAPSALRTLLAVLADIKLTFAREREFRKTFEQLNALSDRDLSDIGLGRGDIVNVARAAAQL